MRFVELTTEQDVELFVDRLPLDVALDTEYTHVDPTGKGVPDPRLARLVSVVISTDGEVGYSIPSHYVHLLKPLARVERIYYQNAKVDMEIMGRYGVDLTDTPFYDAMLLHHLIDENLEHSLDFMVQSYFSDPYKEEFWAKYKSIDEAAHSDRLAYECKDSIYTYKLCKLFLKYLSERMPLVEQVHAMALELYFTERDGLPVDLPLILKTKETMGQEIERLHPAMRAEFLPHCQAWEMEMWAKKLGEYKTDKGRAKCPPPEPFNFGSDRQVAWLVYDQLKLPVLKRTKRTPKGGGNNPSVDYEAIELLEAQGHTLGSLKQYKDIKNLYATFVLGLLERVEDGRIYPAFNVNGTATGRISHSNPNCLSMDTEILTDRGFVGPQEFLPEMRVACYDKDARSVKFMHASNFAVFPRQSRRMVSARNEHLALEVTDNHRCLFEDRKTGLPLVTSASDFRKDARVLHGAPLTDGALEISDDLARLIVATQADAHVSIRGQADFKFTKKRKADRIRVILTNLGLPFREISQANGGYRFYSKAAWSVVSEYLPDKRFSPDLVNLSARARGVFLNEIELWDGSPAGKGFRFLSKYKENVCVVQALCALQGWRALAGVRLRGDREYHNLCVTRRAYSGTANTVVIEENKDCEVWCVTVPTTFFIARRGGSTLITGNCGNMPKDGPFRNFFLPSAGNSIFGCDYGQLEVIVEANLTGDYNTRRIILEGASKHDITALELKIPREAAKTLNFAMGYRCTPFRVQKILGCSASEAEYLWNKYWETYKGVRALQQYCDDRIAAGLPIITPFGRERHFPDQFDNDKDRGRAQRQGYNALIQGTGAECMNISFSIAAKRMRKNKQGRMWFTVHDEGVGEAPTDTVEEQIKLLIKDMESLTQYLNFELPLKAVGYGPLAFWSKC